MSLEDDRPWLLALGFILLAATVAVLVEPPFAFYSPDVSYHAARIIRASEGDLFTDPFSGTPTLYPGLFHALAGAVKRALGLTTVGIVRLFSASSLLGAFGAFWLLARALLPRPRQACAATLALALVLFAPTGRYILVANPVNLAQSLLFLGMALLWRYPGTGRLGFWAWGLALVSLAVNVTWYEALAALGMVVPLLFYLRGSGRLGRRELVAGAVALTLPCAWTVVHLWSIRAVLPSYLGHHDSLVSWGLGPRVLSDWLVVYLTRWNLKFFPQMWRSPFAIVHYLGLVLPFSAGLVVAAVSLARRLRPPLDEEKRLLRSLLGSALLVLLLSLVMAMTGDYGRLAWIQFGSIAFLLLFVFRMAFSATRPAPLPLAAIAVAGTLSLAYTVLHPTRYWELPSPPTGEVVEFIARLPEHRTTRIFATDENVKRLAMFASFTSLVNQRSGRRHSQDPVSAAEHASAYEAIVSEGPGADQALSRWRVRFMALRRDQGDLDADLARIYRPRGKVVLRNSEWLVLELFPDDTEQASGQGR